MTKRFEIHAKFKPAGDQPAAIAQLVEGLEDGLHAQTLLGVTGSGKTFTIANVVEIGGESARSESPCSPAHRPSTRPS